MRSIARQSTRLANSTRSRPPTRRKQEPFARRSFHASVQRHEPRSPNGQPDQSTSLNEWQESHKRFENGVHRQEQSTEQENADPKSTADNRKHGTRRIQRQKRANDVPKPPPIPDWFLENNVRLFKDVGDFEGTKQASHTQVIRCIDTETGHTLFTVPYYVDFKERAARERVARAKRNLEKAAHGTEKSSEDLLRIKQWKDIIAADEAGNSSNQAQNKPKGTLEQDFFDHKFQTSDATAQKHPTDGTIEAKSSDFTPTRDTSHLDSGDYPMRWVFLEAEAGVRAAFSLANENQRAASFASDRVDLSLQCPNPQSHDQMNEFVQDLARITQADVVRLDANDFAELTEDYVGQGYDELGSFSTLSYDVFDGYAANSLRSNTTRQQMEEDEEEDELDEDEEASEDEQDGFRGNSIGPFASIADLRKMLQGGRDQLGNAIRAKVIGIGIGFPPQGQRLAFPQTTSRASAPQSSEMNRDDARLVALLDQLIDAPKQKRAANQFGDGTPDEQQRIQQQEFAHDGKPSNHQSTPSGYGRHLRFRRCNPAFWVPHTTYDLVGYLGQTVQEMEPGHPAFTFSSEPRSSSNIGGKATEQRAKTIIHLPDLRDLSSTRIGDAIIQRLVKVVRKRRRSGEQIVIVGTTAQDVPGPYRMAGEQTDDFPFRCLTVPPFSNLSISKNKGSEVSSAPAPWKSLHNPAYRRIVEINLRHIQSMLRRVRPEDELTLNSIAAHRQLNMPGMYFVSRVLSLDEVQRLALLAIGISLSHAVSDVVRPIHVALAGFIMTKTDHAERDWAALEERKGAERFKSDSFTKNGTDGQSTEVRIDRLKKTCNPHETRLLSGMVDPQNIKIGFADVHAPMETIDALKTVTTLSLLRPDAFKYGVLANDRLPGLLLYGPPGTGKTLLAKAVAKESKATVLEVSGAQIYEKYVGEGEKMVRAVFSLAKKLSPCVVFIDEADAIFGSRSNAGNRNTHREIINQFLREWDGMDDHGVFMMVASNRPFDLDDAVLRRLPRRLLIDLPVARDREAILGLHLKNELLDPLVSLSQLAEQTPLYSGSDLKNLSVAAALACVREENEIAERHKNDADFKLPQQRTLTEKHFEKALAEISASISEDMSSLTAIRKFDEQYGDRKGRRKRASYGFGGGDNAIDEGAARVRQPSSAPPPL